MNSTIKLNKNKLLIYHESRKRRQLVGELLYSKNDNCYKLIYDKKYMDSKKAIPLSNELVLFKQEHISQKGKLFSAFIDRIPEKTNPAYKDYCAAQGISFDEQNPIVLLGFIGRRGPSSFVFEPVYESRFSSNDILKFRNELNISQHDFAEAFDIKRLTLLKIEKGISKDASVLKLVEIYLNFPEVALWQLNQSGGRIHKNTLKKIIEYYSKKQHID